MTDVISYTYKTQREQTHYVIHVTLPASFLDDFPLVHVYMYFSHYNTTTCINSMSRCSSKCLIHICDLFVVTNCAVACVPIYHLLHGSLSVGYSTDVGMVLTILPLNMQQILLKKQQQQHKEKERKGKKEKKEEKKEKKLLFLNELDSALSCWFPYIIIIYK